MLNREYEIFAMNEGESIDELFERFNIIIVGLDAMGIKYPESVLVRRVLRCLTKEWKTKALIISESSSLDSMIYDDLRGNLLNFENTYLKKDSKKKGIAFTYVTNPLDGESSDNSSGNEFLLFAKKFRKMVKLKERNKESSSRRQKKDFSKVTCYNCKEIGHFKSDCPKLKKEEKPKKEKKNGLMASWEDLENDSDDNEESETKSQSCLIADHIGQVVFHNPDTEDLHLMIDHLSEKIRYFLLDNQDLEQQITILKVENGFLKDKLREAKTVVELVEENNQLNAQLRSCESDHSVVAYVNFFKENEELLKKVKNLEYDLAMFTQSSENLNQILASQKSLYDKDGLGFHKTFKSVEKSYFENMASSSNDTRLDEYDGRFVTFGDDGKGKIVAIEKVDKSFSSCINDVLVDGLKHNLLSVNQLCDLGYEVIFRNTVIENDSDCEDAVNKATNEENPKSVQNEEFVHLVLSHQNGGDISVLSPEPARESGTEQHTEAHQSSTSL
ncbi:uncharacterized protein LOC130939846 [Arachis stenosperma]|uniref:uncharacterized protein LOC130939846 n=1 Tax=Arachis stenosperma TaxID=217475 RepID=UPI0025AC849E|nr:uncharacterized protein LOC130939846 [Arachis stenosperma]